MSSDFFAGPATPDVIRTAYRFILRREPDEVGFSHYNGRAGTDRLSVGAMIDDLHRSDEYMHRAAMRNPHVVEVDNGRFKVFVDRNEPDFAQHIIRHGDWEPHIVGVIDRVLGPGMTFVDVGANVGIMSFEAARRVGTTGRVVAFEPSHDNAQNLLRGVKANGFERVVKLYPFALSMRPDIFSLRGGSNGYLAALAGDEARIIQAIVGDDVLLGQPRIDLIKFDIEGHEPFALAGLSRTLAKHKPMVLCEFNPRCLSDHIGKAPAEFARELFSLTSRMQVIEHDGHVERVDSAAELLDLWRIRNAAAVASNFLPDGMLHFDLLFQGR